MQHLSSVKTTLNATARRHFWNSFPAKITAKLAWLLPSLISVSLLCHVAKAASLASWNFDTNQNQLDVRTDEEVRPRVQLIFNPTRLVVDLPGVSLKRTQTVRKMISSVIREVRVGQVDSQTTRLVIELAAGYTLDPNQIQVYGDSPTHWRVKLPTQIQLSSDNSFVPLPQTSDNQKIHASQSQYVVTNLTPKSKLFAGAIALRAEMSDLKPQLQAVIDRYHSLSSGMFFLDLDTGNYLDINGDRIFPAASTIKLPILVALFQDIDAGKISLDEILVMRRDLMTGGSGTMQYQKPGTRFSLQETATKMMTISDNTATNMIIDRLGGIAKLNERFRSWGLQDTVINNMLADLRGTNKTSSKDMVQLLAMLVNQKLVSDASREQILDIMRHTTIKTLLPSGLSPGAVIADKTGDIGFLVGDVGVIDMPNGKRYLAAIYVRRPYKDPIVRSFVREISQQVYNYLDQTAPISTLSSSQTR